MSTDKETHTIYNINHHHNYTSVWVFYCVLVICATWLVTSMPSCSSIPSPPPTPVLPSPLVMTDEEARLTLSAIDLVQKDVAHGKLRTADLTRRALAAELPESVRERVIGALGNPDIDSMAKALAALAEKIDTPEIDTPATPPDRLPLPERRRLFRR